MSSVILLNKPFQTLCQFSDDAGRDTLARHIPTDQFPNFYPAGRLDYDSEGLVLLTDNGKLQNRISDPKHKLEKTYWVQVEGQCDEHAASALAQGVTLKDGPTRPCKASCMADPRVWPRTPPIRERQSVPTSWLELKLTEGKNRQVRRMTAAVGFPTLRLIRVQIGPWSLAHLAPGEFELQEVHLPRAAASNPKNTGYKKPKRQNKTKTTSKNG